MKAEGAALKAEKEFMIGQLDDFQPNKIVTVEVDGRKIGVVRKENSVHAFANHCPHHGAPMCEGKIVGTMMPSNPDEYRYDLDGLVVRCPWHAYEFNVLTGASVGPTIQSRLFIYQTEVRGKDVFCRLKRAAT